MICRVFVLLQLEHDGDFDEQSDLEFDHRAAHTDFATFGRQADTEQTSSARRGRSLMKSPTRWGQRTSQVWLARRMVLYGQCVSPLLVMLFTEQWLPVGWSASGNGVTKSYDVLCVDEICSRGPGSG